MVFYHQRRGGDGRHLPLTTESKTLAQTEKFLRFLCNGPRSTDPIVSFLLPAEWLGMFLFCAVGPLCGISNRRSFIRHLRLQLAWHVFVLRREPHPLPTVSYSTLKNPAFPRCRQICRHRAASRPVFAPRRIHRGKTKPRSLIHLDVQRCRKVPRFFYG